MKINQAMTISFENPLEFNIKFTYQFEFFQKAPFVGQCKQIVQTR